MLAHSMVGHSRISAAPATVPRMPFSAAAPASRALSNARGPSTTHPAIWPAAFICASEAASTLDAMFACTNSEAESTATFGFAFPSACPTATAFRINWTLASKSGAMFSPPSVIITRRFSGRAAYSKTNTSLSNRPVRSPLSGFSAILISVAVSTPPFMSIPAAPLAIASTAALSSANTNWSPSTSRASRIASAVSRFTGPTTSTVREASPPVVCLAACNSSSKFRIIVSILQRSLFAANHSQYPRRQRAHLVFPRINHHRRQKLHPLPDPLDQHRRRRQAARQHDPMQSPFQHRRHRTNLFRDLVRHGLVHAARLLIARRDTLLHFHRRIRPQVRHQSAAAHHQRAHLAFRIFLRKAQAEERLQRQAAGPLRRKRSGARSVVDVDRRGCTDRCK